MLVNVERGLLERSGTRGNSNGCGYVYRVIKSLPKSRESRGAVAEAVWAVFLKARTTNLRLEECQVMEEINRTRNRDISFGSVHNVVRRLYLKGVLTKIGHAYILKDGCNQRPTISAE